MTHSIRELLDAAFGRVGISDWSGLVQQDPRFFRPAEVDVLVGDPSKAREVLGWTPRVGFEELIAMMVDADLVTEAEVAARERLTATAPPPPVASPLSGASPLFVTSPLFVASPRPTSSPRPAPPPRTTPPSRPTPPAARAPSAGLPVQGASPEVRP